MSNFFDIIKMYMYLHCAMRNDFWGKSESKFLPKCICITYARLYAYLWRNLRYEDYRF